MVHIIIPFQCLLQKNLLNRKYKCRAKQDMKFASMCGCIKLLVGTGYDALENTQEDDDTCPDYYLPKLGQLFSVCSDAQYIANKS
jgi:hypothetical protein